MNNKQRSFWWIHIAYLFLGFVLFKLVGPWGINYLFEQGYFSFLNAWTECQGVCAKEFYLGQFEDILFGPLFMLTAGAALVFISLHLPRKTSSIHFGFLIFGFFLVTKFDTFFLPPYGDSASGPCMEAVWLLRNNFDYLALSQETLFVHGGPKAYLISIYPTFLALLMKGSLNTPMFLFLNHLLTMILATIIIVIFWKMCKNIFSEKISLLLALFLLSLPLYQSQSEQINMEIPTMFFLIFSLFFLCQKRFAFSAVAAIFSTSVKLYAIYINVVVFCLSIFELIHKARQRQKIKIFVSGILALAHAIFGAYALFFIINRGGPVDKVGIFQGWHLIRSFPVTYFYLLSFFIYCVYAFRFSRKASLPFLQGIFIFVEKNYSLSIMMLACLGWFLLFLNSFWIPPRYTLILLPSLLIVVTGTIQLFLKNEKIFQRSLIVFILFSFFSSYGFVYKPLIIQDHSIAERSLEYRNDIRLHVRLGKIIEKKYPQFTIAAPFNFAQMYGFPEIGFVNKQLDVMIYLFPCTYGNIKNFDGLENVDISRTIWIGVQTPFIIHPFFPVGPADKVVESVFSGNKSAQLFFGGFSVDKVYKAGQSLMKHLQEKGIKVY